MFPIAAMGAAGAGNAMAAGGGGLAQSIMGKAAMSGGGGGGGGKMKRVPIKPPENIANPLSAAGQARQNIGKISGGRYTPSWHPGFVKLMTKHNLQVGMSVMGGRK
jgi:hypothetical protein